MNHRFRAAFAASAALGAGLLLTACQEGSGTTADATAKTTATSAATPTSQPVVDATETAASGGGQKSGSAGTTAGATHSGGGTKANTGEGRTSDDGAAADKTGYGQGCGSNDLRWSAKSMTQAGGYIQISVSAKPGITCVLPAGLPVVAFGSGGTQAHPAEQSAGSEITLSGGTTVYAGVNPKTTNDDNGTEYSTVIVSVSDGDPHPVSLPVGNTVVDKPVVTNWHTNPADAVPAS
ncbi:hypothetical protein QWJ26_23930 [Streptomyces sp. CSDS2]|uniref:DUF4232 domain-containing protein n=1 Tax=Streptomyces sp. CSDS2 TaxID=3055051 RepID=UPI0025B0DDA5|nr:DUF4232 domain-containing protein [Streptomyces sp. CSDS2]MDN3262796.1 hypothetical protein [Streptomyces sp. CSDS2]